MGRDRRRARKKQRATRPKLPAQQPRAAAGVTAPSSAHKVPTVPRGPAVARLPVLANANLAADLRRIGIVTGVLLVLLIVIWLVL